MYYGFWKLVNYCVRQTRTHTNPVPQVIPIPRSECHAISRFGLHLRLAGAFGLDLMWSYSRPRGWLCLILLERFSLFFPMQLLEERKFVMHLSYVRGESRLCPISEAKCLTFCLYSIKCIFKCHLRGKTYIYLLSMSTLGAY